jgi:hypothetical protein
MSRLLCPGCGERVSVPEGHSRAKLRCVGCGYYIEVPAEMRSLGEVVAAAPTAAAKAPAKKEKAPPPPLLVGTQDEDDDQPYSVPGDELKKCQHCYREIPYDATFCTLCGTDFASGRKAKKEFEPIDRSWEPRWDFDRRIKVFVGLQIINLLLVSLSGFAGGLGGVLTFLLVQGGLQAFLLGSYEKITVKRTAKGAATVLRTWRLAFIPRPPQKLDWKASQGVGIVAVHQPGIFDWLIFLDLLVPTVLPGLLFYWYCIRPDRFHVSLCDVHGSTNEITFRTTDRDQTDEICRVISDATGLWYKPVL